jgi:two-component system sensor histidine kinase TctE
VLADGLAELIENACNFSRPGQRVTITGTFDRGCYRIEVLDEGEGMAMAERERISDFVQFDRERRGQQGLGLGLAIARLTAEYCGGRFTIADGEGGRGLRVTMELPAT